jgi:hypothetical protein
VLFWANQLSQGEATVDLRVGDQTAATVAGTPLTVETTFSIRTVAPNDRRRG